MRSVAYTLQETVGTIAVMTSWRVHADTIDMELKYTMIHVLSFTCIFMRDCDVLLWLSNLISGRARGTWKLKKSAPLRVEATSQRAGNLNLRLSTPQANPGMKTIRVQTIRDRHAICRLNDK